MDQLSLRFIPRPAPDPELPAGEHDGVPDPTAAELMMLRAEVADLRALVSTQPVIERAKGMLMQRFDLDEDAAFLLLRRISQESNVKLREVAVRVVSDGGVELPLTDGSVDGHPKG